MKCFIIYFNNLCNNKIFYRKIELDKYQQIKHRHKKIQSNSDTWF